MNLLKISTILFCASSLVLACDPTSDTTSTENKHIFSITNLTDEQYPDDPCLLERPQQYKTTLFESGTLVHDGDSIFLGFYNDKGDSLVFPKVYIMEFMPTIPKAIQVDEYLSYIGLINQEWNRNQVRFDTSEYHTNLTQISRVDIARNCLNAYLWEVLFYVNIEGKEYPYSHGWFDFPHDLYAHLFEKKNNISFDKYKDPLENWVEPTNQHIDLLKLRTIENTCSITFEDKSDMMYPIKKARRKKLMEIIYPSTFNTMKDLQTDDALFATFSPPGYYNKQDPRTTELGRFYHLKDIILYKVKSKINDEQLHELKLTFKHKTEDKNTTLVLGGINLEDLPSLSIEDANDGWKTSMGIANHSFYENYVTHTQTKSNKNPFYGLLLDSAGNWLDSHQIGIDGPIFHFSSSNPHELHLWLLSFERHALVGHYIIDLKEKPTL